MRAGQPLTVGLTLRRQGGQAELVGVGVRFYVAGGTPSFAAEAGLVLPRSLVPVTAAWSPAPERGTLVLYTQIDPQDQVAENDDGNNLIIRTVTILPRVSDTVAPTADRFSLNNGGVLTD